MGEDASLALQEELLHPGLRLLHRMYVGSISLGKQNIGHPDTVALREEEYL